MAHLWHKRISLVVTLDLYVAIRPVNFFSFSLFNWIININITNLVVWKYSFGYDKNQIAFTNLVKKCTCSDFLLSSCFILSKCLILIHQFQWLFFCFRYERLLRRAKTEDLTEVSGIGCLYQSGVDRLGRPVVVFVGKWFPFNKINLDKVCKNILCLLSVLRKNVSC